MLKIPFATWIANAAARWTGIYGEVTRRAEFADCSRQTIYDHARKVRVAVEDAHDGGPTRAQLIARERHLRHENAQLWGWLEQTVDFPESRQRRWVVVAAAIGLSLDQIRALLTIVLGASACPSRSALHRIIRDAGRAARAVLARLDAACRCFVTVACLDEIHASGRPILMGVEPASLTWFVGLKAADCRGLTWVGTLRPWTALEATVADAGSGLQSGLEQLDRERRAQGHPGLDNGLDVFHTIREAKSVLGRSRRRCQDAWEVAEAADATDRRVGRRGGDRRGPAGVARLHWKQVGRAFARHERAESAWAGAHEAPALFTAEGRLNDRATATAAIAAALPALADRSWAKVRNLLTRRGALSFLDRLHAGPAAAEPDAARREAMARLWWLRRRRPRRDATTAAGAEHVAPLVHMARCQKRGPGWQGSYLRVAAVLRGTVRASSAVEGLNSVVRMHQSRHRTMNQGLIDLKRLYWNVHRFREGRRRDHSPYQLLGLKLPEDAFRSLLGEEMAEAA
jgi:hypothetical protein